VPPSQHCAPHCTMFSAFPFSGERPAIGRNYGSCVPVGSGTPPETIPPRRICMCYPLVIFRSSLAQDPCHFPPPALSYNPRISYPYFFFLFLFSATRPFTEPVPPFVGTAPRKQVSFGRQLVPHRNLPDSSFRSMAYRYISTTFFTGRAWHFDRNCSFHQIHA